MATVDLFIGGLDVQRLYRRLAYTDDGLESVMVELAIDVEQSRARAQLYREAYLQQCEFCDYWFESQRKSDYCYDCELMAADDEEE